MQQVIDVAQWNKIDNYHKVKAAGINAAIIKVIKKDNNPDPLFEKHLSNFRAVGIDVIAGYNYSYATTVLKAKEDASAMLKVIKNRLDTVILDVEDNCQKKLGTTLIKVIQAYQEVITAAGMDFIVYTGLSFYNSYIKPYAGLINCKFWIARYPSNSIVTVNHRPDNTKKPNIIHALWGWQYSSKCKIDGYSGLLDINFLFGELSTIKNPYAEPTYVLYRGKILMSKAYVKWLQWELNQFGFQLTIDGLFGLATNAALMEFQKQQNLVIDGKCGVKTRGKLKEL